MAARLHSWNGRALDYRLLLARRAHTRPSGCWYTAHAPRCFDLSGRSFAGAPKSATGEEDALQAGIDWVGPGFREIGTANSNVFRSADNLRQFRMDTSSVTGAHRPGRHVHLEAMAPDGRTIVTNNHVRLRD